MSSASDKMTSGVILPAVKTSDGFSEVCLLVGRKPMADFDVTLGHFPVIMELNVQQGTTCKTKLCNECVVHVSMRRA